MAKEKSQSLLQVMAEVRSEAERGINPCDEAFMKAFPDLWDVLTSCIVGEDKAVQPAVLTVYNQNGDWSWKVASQAYGVSKAILVKTWAEGLGKLDKALRDPSVPWSVYVKRSVKERKIKTQEKKDLRRNGSP